MKIFLTTVFFTVPLTLLGLAFCFTLIGIPIGITLMSIGAMPLARALYSKIPEESPSDDCGFYDYDKETQELIEQLEQEEYNARPKPWSD